LKRMKKEIRNYVWNFYPDEDMVKQTLNISRKGAEGKEIVSHPSTISRSYPRGIGYAFHRAGGAGRAHGDHRGLPLPISAQGRFGKIGRRLGGTARRHLRQAKAGF